MSYKGTPFPPLLRTQFKYVTRVIMGAVSGSVGIQTYRLNSLYDPDQTGTGTTPAWFSTLLNSSTYTRYTVFGAEVRVRVVNTGSSPMDVAVYASTGTTTLSPELAGEAPFGQSAIVSSAGGGSVMKTLTGKYRVAAVSGVTEETVRTESNFSSAYTGNPASGPFLHVSYQASDLSSTVNGVLRVKIIYHALLGGLNTSSMP